LINACAEILNKIKPTLGEEHAMDADISSGREKGQSAEAIEHSMMDGAQFDMMMAAHRRLFERIEAINKAWLANIQETNKTGSDLALRLVQCKDLSETQALCDAWLRDCAVRLTSFSRYALGSWMELQRMALKSAADGAGRISPKSQGGQQEDVLASGNGRRPPAAPGGSAGRAQHLAEAANP
jgi:hypothetical protein